jgi:hypothetical protein
MTLKREIQENIPKSVQEEPHFHTLLDIIKHHNIETKEHLMKFIKQEIAIVEKWLADNKNSGSTTVKSVRENVLHLDVLKKCLKLTNEYLA